MEIIKGFPSTSQNNTQLNVINIIKHAARNFGQQELVTRQPDGTMFRYTYKDAYERVQRLANALNALGVKAGDRVGVLAWNTHKHYEIYFGLPGTGAVMVLLNLRLAPGELSYVVNHAGISLIIVDEDLLPVAEAIAPTCETVRAYVVISDKKLSALETKLEPLYSFEDNLSAAAPEYEWPNVDETSACSACYTSGTTGRPKGVYYSHRDVYLQALMFVANAMISVKDCVFQIVPMFHVLGWGKPYAGTMAGAKLVFPGKYSLEELDEHARIIVQEKVTLSGGVPSFLTPLLEHFMKMNPRPNLSGTRLICGGSAPPLAMMRDYWDATGAEILHSYGSTEAQAIVTLNQITPWLKEELSKEGRWDHKRKQGHIVVGLDVKIVDDRGAELVHDGKAVGEILLRGPWVIGSYHDAPGSEAQFTSDGYLKSGDVGAIDPEGHLKITDRLKDLIKSGGEWISSVDMENELISHPAILDAAVVGIAHPKWGERPLALVILRDKVDTQAIREHLAKRFARWQLPDEVLFVQAIPRTSVGKIDKKVIRAQYKDLYSDKRGTRAQ
jgi:fatty-acyl-CoA synthase